MHFEEGAELSVLEGDANGESVDSELTTEGASAEGGRRDLQVESLWEYGPRRGFWRLLDIISRHDVQATFFCAGQALERNPEAAREISERGHEACGLGYRFVPYYNLAREEEKAQIERAVRAIQETTGQRPLGWHSRAPSLHTRELLVENGGFLYDSDSYGDDLPYFVEVEGRSFLTIPHSYDVNDGKFWARSGVSGFCSPEDFFTVMKDTFDRLYSEGATRPRMMSVGLHLRISGTPSRALQVERFVRYAKGHSRVWFARRVDVARWWLERYGQQ